MNGLEDVPQTPRESPVPVVSRGTENHHSALLLQRKEIPPCLVSEMANGRGEL